MKVYKKMLSLVLSVALLMSMNGVTKLSAASKHMLSLSAHDEQDIGVGSGAQIQQGAILKPGYVFRVDMDFDVGPTPEVGSIGSTLVFDTNIFEMTYFEGAANILMASNTLDGGVYPATKNARGQVTNYWDPKAEYNAPSKTIIYGAANVNVTFKPLDTTGPLVSFYLKVKETAAPGSEGKITITKDEVRGFNGKIIDYGVTPDFKITVAGAQQTSDTSLKSLELRGVTDSKQAIDGHDHNYMEGLFSESAKRYSLVVPSQVSAIKETNLATKDSSLNAIFGPASGGASGRTLNYGDNQFFVSVKKNGGDVGEPIPVSIYRLSDDVGYALTSITTSDGVTNLSDATNKGGGTIKVSAGASSLNVSGAVSHANARVSYNGSSSNTISLSTTSTETGLVVNVQSEETLDQYSAVYANKKATRDYTYTFKKSSNNPDLKTLSVNDTAATLVNGSDPKNHIYSIDVLSDVSTTSIQAETLIGEALIYQGSESDNANLVIKTSGKSNRFEASKPLKSGENKVYLEARAEDGTARKYTLIINKKLKEDATLKSLSVRVNGGANLVTNFNPQTLTYDLGEIAYQENAKVEIVATLNDASASITNASVLANPIELSPQKALNQSILVAAENRLVVGTYTVLLKMKPNSKSEIVDSKDPNNPFKPSDGNSAGVEIKADDKDASGKPLDPNGQGDGKAKDDVKIDGNDVYRYTVYVPNETLTFGLASLKFTQPTGSKVVGGADINLVTGSNNTFDFWIEPADSSAAKSHYIFTIVRKQSSIARLETLSPNVGSMVFSSDVFNYTLSVPSSTTAVIFNASGHNGSSVVGLSPQTHELKNGDTFTIRAQSEDGKTTQAYVVKIVREKSSENKLATLVLDGQDVLAIFEAGGQSTIHSKQFEADKTSVRLEFTKRDPLAVVSYEGNVISGNYLDVILDAKGSKNVALRVQSESGVSYNYYFTLSRKANTNALLNSLNVNGSPVFGFVSEVFDYTAQAHVVRVANTTKTVDIQATPQNGNASVVGVGSKSLVIGSNTFNVVVSAEDGVTKNSYTVVVYREPMANPVDNNGLVPISPVESIDENTDIKDEDKQANNYYYVAYVPSSQKTFTDKDIALSKARLDDGYTITKYYNNPLTIVKGNTKNNVFRFDVGSKSGELIATYNIEVRYLDIDPPHIEAVKINGKPVTGLDMSERAFTINVDSYLDKPNTDINVELVLPSGKTINERTVYTYDLKGQASLTKDIIITDSVSNLLTTYRFTFTKTLSSNNALKALNVSALNADGTQTALSLDRELNTGSEDIYEVSHVSSAVDTVVIAAQTADQNARIVSGGGERTVKPGKNIFKLLVLAEDTNIVEDARIYTLIVYRDLALNSLKLGSINIDVSKPSRVETDGTIVYTLAQPIASTDYIQEVRATASDASVALRGEINRQVDLQAGTHYLEFMAVGQGDVRKTFRLEYNRLVSSDGRLASLTLSDASLKLEPSFNPDTKTYTLKVPYTKTRWSASDFNATAIHGKTSIRFGGVDLSEANTVYTIETQAEDLKDTHTYTLNIEKEGNNYLADLSVGSRGVLVQTKNPSKGFDPTILEYDLTVFAGGDDFSVRYLVMDAKNAIVKNSADLTNIKVSQLPKDIFVTVVAGNGVEKTYTIHAEVGVSSRLSSLSTDSGVITPNFNPEILSYDMYVAQDVKQITWRATPEDPQAKIDNYVAGGVTEILVPGKNTFSIKVRNGAYTSTYTLNVYQVADKTGIGSMFATYGSRSWQAQRDENGTYAVVVPEGVDLNVVGLDVRPEDPNSQSALSAPVYEGNTVRYVVNITDDQKITKSYNVVVTRELSDNNFLKLLQIDGSDVVGFTKTQETYTYKLNKDSLKVTAIAEDSLAGVVITYPDAYINDAQVRVDVTSQKGTKRTYTIALEKDADNTAILQRLGVVEGTLSPKFVAEQFDYYITIPYEVESITPVYLEEAGLKVSVRDNQQIPVGENHTVSVDVVSPTGDTNTYRIHVTRVEEASNYLESLSVSGADGKNYALTPGFKPSTSTYVVMVDDETQFNVAAKTRAENTLRGDGVVSVVNFPYDHTVRVVSKNNVPRLYTIQFIKKKSANTDLANLSVQGANLDPIFDKDTTVYNIDVDSDVQSITLDGDKVNEHQVISNLGTHTLKPGRNTISVKVTAEDGSSKVYTVIVNRAPSNAEFGLDSLTVSAGTLSPSFAKGVKTYYVNVDDATTSLDISATSSAQGAKISGLGTKQLNQGANTFKVTLTGGRNETTDYTIIVNRGVVTSNYLAHLKLQNATLNETFAKEKQDYTATFVVGTSNTLSLDAQAEDAFATVEISGANNLQPGIQDVVIKVNRDGMETRVYTIKVDVKVMKIESSIHQVGETYIETIHDQQTVSDVKKQMLNPYEHLVIYRDGSALKDTDFVGTGAIIKLVVDGVEYDQKTLVVKGDLNGDGRVGVVDIVNLRSYILGGNLSPAQIIAADINKDSRAGVVDLVAIRAYILGTRNIFE